MCPETVLSAFGVEQFNPAIHGGTFTRPWPTWMFPEPESRAKPKKRKLDKLDQADEQNVFEAMLRDD
jgi:hypothetical protein